MAEKLILELEARTGNASKNLEKVKQNTTDIKNEATSAASEFSIMGVSINGVKSAFGKVTGVAKGMFSSIKMGIASTGIGLFVLAIGSLTQYFRDSEEGASKLREITSQLGVAFGNVTDIVSNLGKGLFALLSGDFDAMKVAFADATDQVKNFGEQTREEMAIAKQLEKDRLALQQFERKAAVDAAKTNSEIMRLRLDARDIEKFTAEQRLGFMREANKLADEQLQKDLHVANEKLRFQQIENSFSKSSQENLDAEASLQVDVHNITRSNFSERKRMKSEEQALVRELQAAQKSADTEKAKAREQDFKDAEKFNEELFKIEEERIKKEKAAKKIADADKIATDKLVANAKQQLALQSLGFIGNVFGQESEAGKAAAVATATMNTYQAATNAMANTPLPPPFPMIASGLAIAAGLANVDKILNTPIENKFAAGGMVGGFGTGTSDSISARLSKGESVINARSTRMFRPLLSAINQAGGGENFDSSIDGGAGGHTMGVVKAFVVSDDITRSQNKLSKIRKIATI